MKFKSLFVGISAILLLAACNSGGGTTSSDVQNISGSGGSSASGSTYNYSITGTATNCRVTPNNCLVNLSYASTGTLNNSTLSYTINGGTPSQVQGCTQSSPCNFTIYGSNSNAQQVIFSLTGTQTVITNAQFIIGGGI
ncbi:MAG: hypothetical protein KBD37_08940 [Burkholderiales bacterium]|nr:hypothetical protein [Burkholderiales bacterium]